MILSDFADLAIDVRRSRRAKRLSLRVSSLDGRVTLTAPPRATERAIRAFVGEHREWVQQAVAKTEATIPVGFGAQVPVRGQLITVVAGQGRSVRHGEVGLEVPVRSKAPGRAVAAYLKKIARDDLAEACDRYASRLGRPYSALTLRDTRSRWGSCSSQGRLMFSWRLIMAPPAVLDYVAAHEVAHLAEMNHGSAFWEHVSALCPDQKTHRAWLRREGMSLHRWRFDVTSGD